MNELLRETLRRNANMENSYKAGGGLGALMAVGLIAEGKFDLAIFPVLFTILSFVNLSAERREKKLDLLERQIAEREAQFSEQYKDLEN